MSMILLEKDLNQIITEDPPNPLTNEWRKKDEKTRAIINLAIEDSQIVHVRNLSTAKETWNTLKLLYERKNLSSKLHLLRKLYNTKLDEKGNMNMHITKILEIVNKLQAIGEDISDSHISAILLCSMPQSYDTLITALEARPEQELNSEYIRSKLVDEYQRRLDNQRHFEQPTRAFQINKRGNFNYRNKRERYCSFCKMKNHDRTNCWNLNRQSQYQQQTPKYQGNNHYRKNKSSFCYSENNECQNNQENKYSPNIDHNTVKMKNLALMAATSTNKQSWIIDSGSSSHITNNEKLFSEIVDTNKSEVVIANGKSLTSYGSGNIEIKAKTSDGNINNITLKNVLLVPEIETNLLSVNKVTQKGCTVVFSKNTCQIKHDGITYIEGTLKNNLYEASLNNPITRDYAQLTRECCNKNCIDIWHKRLGHRNYGSIKEIKLKDLATGLTIDKCQHDTSCESCITSKLTDSPYPTTAQNRATQVLEIVHSDVCGPLRTATIGGKSYFLTLTDDYSRFTIIYLMSNKDEVTERIKEYVAMVNNKFGKKPQNLRTDNGGEFTNKELEKYLRENGIHHQLTVPYCPSQNGVAERKNRTLMEMTRAMITESGLPHHFWGEAINTSNYIINHLPTKANHKTPYEIWTNKKPDLSHFKVFGCKAYYYIDKHKRGKLDNRAREGIFVGYDCRSKGYRVYTNNGNVTISRTVKFLENTFPFKNSESTEEFLTENSCNTNGEIFEKSIEISMDNSLNETETENDKHTSLLRRSERLNKGVPPDRLVYLTHDKKIYEPKGWEEVNDMKNPTEKENWIRATQEEINSLKQNNTWSLVDAPQGNRVIGSRWTFKAKRDSSGNIEKYKARLVAKGYSQKYGEDFYETYAPVVSYTTIRALLAMASHKKLTINHLDVKTAFLHGELEEEVYMTQPEGYITPGEEKKVCKLNKAIYGLKQAARAWNTKIANTLKRLNFEQSTTEQCLFKQKVQNDITYIIVYVDDILIAGKQNRINEVVKQLQSEYEIKNLGEINYYLGISIRKNQKGNYTMSQKLKIDELVSKFNLENSKPCSTPIETGYQRTHDDDNLLPNNTKYRQAIGTLLYIATISRPDICAAINILSRRNENPRQKDWEQVKRVIRYLKTTREIELIIDPSPEPVLTTYADADWGGDNIDRKSTSGNLFLLGKAPIHWLTKKQGSVALSSAEAEFISAANATQEIAWIIKVLEDLDLPQRIPITLLEDNQSAIKMIESPKHTNKTKHIDIKWNYIRDSKEKGMIDLQYCPTKYMTADILTKPLPKPDFQRHRLGLQLYNCNDSPIEGEC